MMMKQEEMESGFLRTPLVSERQTRRSSCVNQEDEQHTKNFKNQTINKDNLSSSFSFGVLFSTFVAVCGSISYGFAMSYSSPAQSKIMEEMGLSFADYSVFTSIVTLGGLITAALSGKIAALISRRHTMWLSDILCTAGWLIIALAKDALWLDIGRFSLGLGVGLISYVVPVYLAEIAPKNIRGGITFSNQLLQSFGISLLFFVGNFIHWRTLAILCAIPCAMQTIGLFFIPESPRWLAMYGRDRLLEVTLKRLRGNNTDVLQEAAQIREAVEISKREFQAGIRDLFQMKYAYSLTIGLGLMLLQQLCGSSVIVSYAANIFDIAGFPSEIGTTIIAAIMVPKSLVVLLTVDRWGRRPLLLASSIGLFICSFIIGISINPQISSEFQKLFSVLLIVGIMGYVAAFAIGLGGLPWVIMSEIFPVNIKVTAGSLVTVANWFFSFIIVYTFNYMMQWSASGTYYIYSGVSFVTIVFVWTMVPETKGRTLEEIQASFI